MFHKLSSSVLRYHLRCLKSTRSRACIGFSHRKFRTRWVPVDAAVCINHPGITKSIMHRKHVAPTSIHLGSWSSKLHDISYRIHAKVWVASLFPDRPRHRDFSYFGNPLLWLEHFFRLSMRYEYIQLYFPCNTS